MPALLCLPDLKDEASRKSLVMDCQVASHSARNISFSAFAGVKGLLATELPDIAHFLSLFMELNQGRVRLRSRGEKKWRFCIMTIPERSQQNSKRPPDGGLFSYFLLAAIKSRAR